MTESVADSGRTLAFCQVQIEGHVATVTIDRPDRHNALHPQAHKELESVFDRLAADLSLRVVIVTGAGNKAFCAGYDLKDNLETGRMELSSSGFAGFNDRQDFPLPTIAAVNGIAFGGGFELALACDLIVAARSASFALPEPKVGWAALGGGVQRLPQAIGMKRAMDIILTGRAVDAAEAHALGVVAEVCEDEMLLNAAHRWAASIAACAPLAIRTSRSVAYGSFGKGWRGPADLDEHPVVQEMLASEDALEGKRAFAERRPPIWQNR
nr:enoyl-CoA hydratase-related protein [Mesorhizobium sp.]